MNIQFIFAQFFGWILMPLFCFDTTTETTNKELKEVLGQIVNFKEILDKTKQYFSNSDDQAAALVDLVEKFTNIEGNIAEMGKKVIEIGNKQIVVQKSGLSYEQKLDFAKFFSKSVKCLRGDGDGDSLAAVKEIQAKYSHKAGQNEGTDADGGYFVPEQFEREVWRAAEQASVILPAATKIPLTTGYKMPILSLTTGVGGVWVNEAAGLTEATAAFGKASIAAEKYAAYTVMSSEVIEDEEVGLVDLLITLYGEDFGAEFDLQALTGDGNPFTGVLAASGTNNVAMPTGESEFIDVNFDHLSEMNSKVKASVIAGARYYLHRTILQLLQEIKTTGNNYVWQAPANGQPGTIWNYPYVLSEQMPSISDDAVSTPFVAFGSPKYIAIGTRGNTMTVILDRSLKLLNDQVVLVVKQRIAEAVALAEAFAKLTTAAS